VRVPVFECEERDPFSVIFKSVHLRALLFERFSCNINESDTKDTRVKS